MKKYISIILLVSLIFSIAIIPKTVVLAHDADGIYYVPSIVKDGIRDYTGVDLYYKQDGVEDKTDERIFKPTSRMNVTVNGQSAYDGQTISSTVGKSIVIDFSQSTSISAPIAEIGLQITNGTGKYQSCWTSLPNGSEGTSYASQYPFSWGAASFTPDMPGTYTIYGEVRADIDRSEVFEHWDVWSANGSHPIVDTIQAHTSYPNGPIQSYNVTWHFEKITVIVTEQNLPPVAVITAPDTCNVGSDVNISGEKSYDTDGTIKDYTWETTGASGTINGVTGTVKYNAEGVYTIKLKVTDDKGASGSTTKLISVTTPNVEMAVIHVRYIEQLADGSIKDIFTPFDMKVPYGTKIELNGDTLTITYPNGTVSYVKAETIPGYTFEKSEMTDFPKYPSK